MLPFRRASEGVMPWNFWKAFAKLSGESYPYFSATSITFASPPASSAPASVSLRHRIYSPRVQPQRIENTR